MIYNLSITPGMVNNVANIQKVLNVFQAIITNKQVADADMPAMNAPYSMQILGKYPTARPYTFVYKEVDTTNKNGDGTLANPAYATLWFKKEHPLYAGHFTYIGVRFMPTLGMGTFGQIAIFFDIAELVTDTGTIINRVWGSNSSYKFYAGVNASSNSTSVNFGGPIINRSSAYYFNTYTMNISDFGLGIFSGDMSGSPVNAFLGNYQGTLMLESIATVAGNPQAFISDNYPMIASIFKTDSYNTGAANTRCLGMIRIPDLAGLDQPAPYSSSLFKVIDSAIFQQPSSAGAVAYGSTFGSDNTVMEVINANGVKASELYPEYVRNAFGGSPIAKLPVLRPLQGGPNYAHYGRTIALNTTESWVGIEALEDFDNTLINVSSNAALQTLKKLPYRQAYLRMD